MDYSKAQNNGFVEAFVELMVKCIPAFDSLSPESKALETAKLHD